MSIKFNNLTGYKLEEVPVVLTPTEVSLILQIDEKEVTRLIVDGLIKPLPLINEIRIAAHSLFEFLHHEDVKVNNALGTGFVDHSQNLKPSSKIGFLNFDNSQKGYCSD